MKDAEVDDITRVRKTNEERMKVWEEYFLSYKEKTSSELLVIFCDNLFLDMYYGLGGGDSFERTAASYFLDKRGYQKPLIKILAIYKNFGDAIWEIRTLSGQWYPSHYDAKLAREKCGVEEESQEELEKWMEHQRKNQKTEDEKSDS